jgi:hypothetical protein
MSRAFVRYSYNKVEPQGKQTSTCVLTTKPPLLNGTRQPLCKSGSKTTCYYEIATIRDKTGVFYLAYGKGSAPFSAGYQPALTAFGQGGL